MTDEPNRRAPSNSVDQNLSPKLCLRACRRVVGSLAPIQTWGSLEKRPASKVLLQHFINELRTPSPYILFNRVTLALLSLLFHYSCLACGLAFRIRAQPFWYN